MKTYKLTVYEQTGKLVVEETFAAATDDEAKVEGTKFIEQHAAEEKTYRLASPTGQLLLFHS